MVDAQRARVEEAMTKMLNDLDKTYLRKCQAQMHRCAATCCDSEVKSIEEVQHCVELCSQPLSSAHNFVQSELKHFQDRLQRCVMECNDKIRDKITGNPTDSEVRQYTYQFEACATECVSSHVLKIPSLLEKMKKTLSGPNYQVK